MLIRPPPYAQIGKTYRYTTNARLFIQLICSVVFHVAMHQSIAELHLSVYKPHTTHNSSIRSDEGLTLSKRQFRIPLRWQIHIINPVDKTKLSCNTPTGAAPQFL